MGVIDEFVQNFSKGVSKVQVRSQEMLHAYNLTQQIKEWERKKSVKLLEIGRLICEKYQRQAAVPESLLKDRVNEITVYEREIAAIQNTLESMRMQNDPRSKESQSTVDQNSMPGFSQPGEETVDVEAHNNLDQQ